MRVETVVAAAQDDSTHVLRWTEGDGDDREQVVEGEHAAMVAWNELHEGTVDPVRRVRNMRWVERVQLRDERGTDLGVEERQRAHFSHDYGSVGVFTDVHGEPIRGA